MKASALHELTKAGCGNLSSVMPHKATRMRATRVAFWLIAILLGPPVLGQTPTVTLAASDATATELGLSTGAFTVTRAGGGVTSALTVSFTHSGTAGNNSDFVFIGGSVVIPATQASATFLVTPIADNLVEINETVVLSLAASASYSIGSPSGGTVTLIDDPAIVTLNPSDATATELGLTTGAFTFTRSGGDLGAQLTVSVARGGTAGNNVDYVFGSDSISIPSGQMSVIQQVTPFADNIVEGIETVAISLSASSNYLIGSPNGGTISIADDPAIVSLVASDANASEVGLDPGVFTFTRSGGDFGAQLSVGLVRTGTASNNVDYAFGGNTVSIPAGQGSATQLVSPIADNLVEGSETVILNLNPDSGFIAGNSASATVTLADSAPVVRLSASDPLADEAGLSNGAFTFTRSGGNLGEALNVGVTRAGTASNNVDYAFSGNQISIPAGQISVVQLITPFADNLVEADETVTANLVASSTYLIGSPNAGTVTIADDPAVLTINIMDPIATERDADPGSFVITRGGGDLSASLTVSLTLSGSATLSSDYQFVPTSVAIPAGLSSVLVQLVPIFDLNLEGNETVTLQLNPTANYLVDTPASATLIIVDFIDAVFQDQFE